MRRLKFTVIPACFWRESSHRFLDPRLRHAGMTVLLAMTFLLFGCGQKSEFKRIRSLEKKGRYYEAWHRYQEFAVDHPKSELAPKALFSAGLLAQRQLKDCRMASVFYDQVIERYPQADPWGRLSTLQKNNCPDYFPLLPGATWVEGDSETGGKNARIEIASKLIDRAGELPAETGILSRTFFAGPTRFRTSDTFYRKSETELKEYLTESDLQPKIILTWPLVTGTRWRTKSGDRIFTYEIEANDRTVKVSAGEFQNCLVVRSFVEGGAATYEYFAPNVGRVLTTLQTKDGEKRNTELMSHTPAPDFNFDEIKGPQ